MRGLSTTHGVACGNRLRAFISLSAIVSLGVPNGIRHVHPVGVRSLAALADFSLSQPSLSYPMSSVHILYTCLVTELTLICGPLVFCHELLWTSPLKLRRGCTEGSLLPQFETILTLLGPVQSSRPLARPSWPASSMDLHRLVAFHSLFCH
ncbi:hypothetical protein VTK56DRAFT_7975 [Thermocarpiscus australiensis]